MILTVNVTQEMIDNGVQDNCEKCPVALALIQAANEANYSYAHLEVTDNAFLMVWNRRFPGGMLVELSGEVAEFIYSFDEYGPLSVEPISFEVALP